MIRSGRLRTERTRYGTGATWAPDDVAQLVRAFNESLSPRTAYESAMRMFPSRTKDAIRAQIRVQRKLGTIATAVKAPTEAQGERGGYDMSLPRFSSTALAYRLADAIAECRAARRRGRDPERSCFRA